MKSEYTDEELFLLLHNCNRNEALLELICELPKDHLDILVDEHFKRLDEEEERAFIETHFVAGEEEIILTTNTYEPDRSTFRLATKRATT